MKINIFLWKLFSQLKIESIEAQQFISLHLRNKDLLFNDEYYA